MQDGILSEPATAFGVMFDHWAPWSWVTNNPWVFTTINPEVPATAIPYGAVIAFTGTVAVDAYAVEAEKCRCAGHRDCDGGGERAEHG